MRDALYSAGRPILFSICEWGNNQPWLWAKDIGHSWRTTGDIAPVFDGIVDHGTWRSLGVMQILDLQDGLREFAGPGHWNDPDMLQVGNGMSVNQDRAHFTMWCMLAAPLLLGNDLTNMSDEVLRIITNKDVIAVNQDPLGVQGLLLRAEEGLEFWFKPLDDGAWAFCILNRGTDDVEYTIRWEDFNFTDEFSGRSTMFDSVKYSAKNLWSGKIDGNTKKQIKKSISGQDVLIYRLDPIK